MMMLAALLALAPQDADEAEKRKAPPGETQAKEVRVYLLDKQHKPAPLKDVSASLVFEDPNGTRRTVPLSYVTPKGGETFDAFPMCQFKDVEQTSYIAGFCVMKAKPAGAPKDPRTMPDDAKPGAAPRMADLSRAPYYKADLMKEQMPADASTAAVVFTIDGEQRHAKGFRWAAPDASKAGQGENMEIPVEIRRLEAAIKGHDLAGANASLDRIVALIGPATGPQGEKDKDREKCLKTCEDIRTALKDGNRDDALDGVGTLRDKCGDLKPAPKK